MGYHSLNPLEIASPQPPKSCSLHPVIFLILFSVLLSWHSVLFVCLFFLSFHPSCILTLAEDTTTLTDSGAVRDWCSQSTHYPGKQTGASHSWESHETPSWHSTDPKSGPGTLLEAPPCWIRGNNPRQTQTSGSGEGEHTHHLPWSLKVTCHGRFRNHSPLFPPEALSEIVWFVTTLRSTAGQQAETGRGGSCGEVGCLLTHPWPQCWSTDDKSQLCRAAKILLWFLEELATGWKWRHRKNTPCKWT